MNPLIEPAIIGSCEPMKINVVNDVLRVKDEMIGNCGTNPDDEEYAFYDQTTRRWPHVFYWRLVVEGQQILFVDPYNITGDANSRDEFGQKHNWNLNRVPAPNTQDVVSLDATAESCHYHQSDSDDNWSLGHYNYEFSGGQCASSENIVNRCENYYDHEPRDTTPPPGMPPEPEPIPDIVACDDHDFDISLVNSNSKFKYQGKLVDNLMIPVRLVGHALQADGLTPIWLADINQETFASHTYKLKGRLGVNNFPRKLEVEPTAHYVTISDIPINLTNGDHRTVSFDIFANQHPEYPCNGEEGCYLWDPVRERYITECGEAIPHEHPDKHGLDYWPKCTIQFDVGNPVYKD